MQIYAKLEREDLAELFIQRDWVDGLPMEWDTESASTSIPSLIDLEEGFQMEDNWFTQSRHTLSQQQLENIRNALVYVYEGPLQTYSLLNFEEHNEVFVLYYL